MAGVLEGLKVLDLTWGIAGPMTTMLLADHGADVTRIERPGGEPFVAPDGYRVWHRGKRSAELDLRNDADRDVFLQLARNADVVVESFAPGAADSLGIGYERLHELNPRLVYCSITAYGRGNKHSDRPGYDALVAARTGLQWEARGWYGSPMDHVLGRDAPTGDVEVPDEIRIGARHDGPIFTATATPSVATAYLATLGISGALRAREVTGRGQHVETSMLQAVILFAGTYWQRAEHPDAPAYDMHTVDRRQTWGLVNTRDRWVCSWATSHEWAIASGAGDEIKVPDDLQEMFRGPRRSHITIADRLAILMEASPIWQKFDAADWVKAAADAGNISCQLIRKPEEALTDPLLMADGSVTEVEDPELGTLREAGILYRMHGCPTKVRASSPKRGQHTAEVRAEAASSNGSSTAPSGGKGRETLNGPFDGIRIVDFGAAVAGPWATQVLADLGADVIKVDPTRQTFWIATHMAIGVNRSKRHVGVDMKTPEGKEFAEKLIRSADVVMLNLRPNAGKKLGLDYESVRALNPAIVYCHTRGHEDGPRSNLPGNDQTGNALGGTEWEDGGCWNGGRPWFGVTSGGDLGNGYLACIGIAQALYHRERTGEGQMVDASILNAALFNNSRVFTTPDGTHFDRPTLDADQFGFNALYRLYQCADGWLCVAVLSDREWQALERAVPAVQEKRNDDAGLATVLTSWCGERKVQDAFQVLDGAGVPCEVSDPTFSQTLYDDPEMIERRWVVTSHHPVVGRIDMFGGGIDFSDTPAEPGGDATVFGQHTREVLAEYGYTSEQINAMCASGAVTAAEVPA